MVGDHNRSFANNAPSRSSWNGTKFLGILLVLAQVTLGFAFQPTAAAALDPCAADLSAFQLSNGTTMDSSRELNCPELDAPTLATIIAYVGGGTDKAPSIDTSGVVDTIRDAITADPGIDTDAVVATAVAAVQDILRYDPGIDINQVIQNAKDQADVCDGNYRAAVSVDCQAIIDNARDQVTALLAQWLGVVGDCTGGGVSSVQFDAASSSNAAVSCSEVKILANQMVNYVLNLVVPAVGQVAACLSDFANTRAVEASSSSEGRVAGVDCGQARGLLDDTVTETSAWAIQFGTGLVTFLSDCASGGGAWNPTAPAVDGEVQAGDPCATVWSGVDVATSALGSVLATVNDCNSAFGATGNPAFRADPGQGESLVACGDALREVADTATGLTAFAAECTNDVVRADEAIHANASTPVTGDSESEFTAVDCAAVADAAHALVAWALAIVQPHVDDAADCAKAMAGSYGDHGGILNCQDLKRTAVDLVDQWLAFVLDYAPQLIDYLESCASDGGQPMPVPNEEAVRADGGDPCAMTWDAVHPVFGLLGDVVATAGDCAGQNNLASVLATQNETGEPLLACGQAIADLYATLFGVASYVAQCAGDATGIGAEEFYAQSATAATGMTEVMYVQPDCEDFGQPRSVTLLEACNVQDADSDLVPRADVCAKTYTFDPRAKSTSTDQGGPQLARTGIGDPDDTDPTNPVPDPDRDSVRADAGACDDDADAVCYDVGLCYEHMGTRVCRYETGRVESGLLPLDLPAVPTGLTLGPDNDGDGFPVGFFVEQTQYRIESDGRLSPVGSSSSYGRIDTDDGDRNNPVPHDVGGDLIDEAERLAREALDCAARAGGSYQACLETICDNVFNGRVACDVYGALAPKACFEHDPEWASTGDSILFDASCSEDSLQAADLLEYRWDWETDGAWDQGFSASELAEHAYATSGYKEVTLEVRNAYGLQSSASKSVLIDDPPTACIEGPTKVRKGVAASFSAACTQDDFTSNGDLHVSWDWDGDGTWDEYSTASKSVTHTFDAYGTYTVHAEVRDRKGLASSAETMVRVVSTPSVILTVSPGEQDVEKAFTFDATASDDLWPQSSLQADYDLNGDGAFEIVDGGFDPIAKSFSSTGKRVAHVRVTNPEGSTTLADVTFVVDGAPIVKEDRPEGGTPMLQGTEGDFHVSVLDPGTDLVSVTFDWNDGTTTTTPQAQAKYGTSPGTYWYPMGTHMEATKTYNAPGSYCVKAQATDEDGNKSPWTGCRTIEVQAPTETPAAPIGPGRVHVGESYAYQTSALDPDGDQIRYVFDWDDGSQDTTTLRDSGVGGKKSHAWAAAGTYCVRAQAIDGNGFPSAWSDCSNVEVIPKPTACFDHTVAEMAIARDASCSTGDILEYRWSLGDGNIDAGRKPSNHRYDYRSAVAGGTFTVTLTVDDGVGEATFSREVQVGMTDEELAMHWAPVFYHDTDSTNPRADQFTRFEFDGDWIGTNNWGNEPKYAHPGEVYYSIHETEDRYFISYMVFHPRDWSECEACWAGVEHENDMEGAILAIVKDGTEEGVFESLITMAHNWFMSYTDPTNPTSARLSRHHSDGPSDEGGTVTFWNGHHPELEIEAHGHGMYAAHDDMWWNPDPYDYGKKKYLGDYGTTYYPTGQAEEPADGNDRNVGYALVPLSDLWSKRYGDGYADMWAGYGVFKGDDNDGCGWNRWSHDGCASNAAAAPWAMHNWEQRDTWDAEWTDQDLYGTWFEHPAELMDTFFGNADYDGVYAYRSTGGVWESFHKYQNSRDYTYTWTVPGASNLEVTLPRVELGSGDSLRIDDGSGNTHMTFGAHTSKQNTTRVVVPGDTIVFQFNVDSEGKEWGFFVSDVTAKE